MRRRDKMSNGLADHRRPAKVWRPFAGSQALQPAISSRLIAANAGSVIGSLAALEATG